MQFLWLQRYINKISYKNHPTPLNLNKDAIRKIQEEKIEAGGADLEVMIQMMIMQILKI